MVKSFSWYLLHKQVTCHLIIYFQDNDDLNIHDDTEDTSLSPTVSLGAWPHLSVAPSPVTTAGPGQLRPGGHLQVSALGQLLGQNGNIANMVSSNTWLMV